MWITCFDSWLSGYCISWSAERVGARIQVSCCLIAPFSPRSFRISGPASSTAEEKGVQSHPLLQWSLPSRHISEPPQEKEEARSCEQWQQRPGRPSDAVHSFRNVLCRTRCELCSLLWIKVRLSAQENKSSSEPQSCIKQKSSWCDQNGSLPLKGSHRGTIFIVTEPHYISIKPDVCEVVL